MLIGSVSYIWMPQILNEQTGYNEPNLTQCEVLQVSNCAASIDHYLVVQTHISCTTTKRWKSVPTISKACIFIFKSQFFSCFQIETLYSFKEPNICLIIFFFAWCSLWRILKSNIALVGLDQGKSWWQAQVLMSRKSPWHQGLTSSNTLVNYNM